MIKRLRVKGFKSLYDLDVTFSPLTVLFGANTSGKSNVLDVIQLLAKSTSVDNVADIFTSPFRGNGWDSFSFKNHDTSPHNDNCIFEIKIDLKVSPLLVADIESRCQNWEKLGSSNRYITEDYMRYELSVNCNKDGFLYVSHEDAFALNSNGDPKENSNSFIYSSIKKYGQEKYRIPQIKGLKVRTFLSHAFPAVSSPHAALIQEELRTFQVFFLDPQVSMRIPDKIRETYKLGSRGEYLSSFLYTLKKTNAFQWETFQKALHHYIPEITAVDVVLNPHGEVELFVMEDGHRISARLMSDGTLTLMGLVAIGCMPQAGVIGIDEPENGVYPTRMDLIGRFLEFQADENRQLIVATHSPILMDYLPLDSLYMCQKKAGRTTVVPLRKLPGISYVSDDLALSEVLVSGLLDG
jgi:predicted ATPase